MFATLCWRTVDHSGFTGFVHALGSRCIAANTPRRLCLTFLRSSTNSHTSLLFSNFSNCYGNLKSTYEHWAIAISFAGHHLTPKGKGIPFRPVCLPCQCTGTNSWHQSPVWTDHIVWPRSRSQLPYQAAEASDLRRLHLHHEEGYSERHNAEWLGLRVNEVGKLRASDPFSPQRASRMTHNFPSIIIPCEYIQDFRT